MLNKSTLHIIFLLFLISQAALIYSCSLITTIERRDDSGNLISIEQRVVDTFQLLGSIDIQYTNNGCIKKVVYYNSANNERIINRMEKYRYEGDCDYVRRYSDYIYDEESEELMINEIWAYEYDARFNRVFAENYAGKDQQLIKKMTIEYDVLGNIIHRYKLLDNTEIWTDFQWDDNGRPVVKQTRDSTGREVRTTWRYDDHGRLIFMSEGQKKYSYEYNTQGRLTGYRYVFDDQLYAYATREYLADGRLNHLEYTQLKEDQQIDSSCTVEFMYGTPVRLESTFNDFILEDSVYVLTLFTDTLTNPTEISMRLALDPVSCYGPEPVIPEVNNPLYLETWYPFYNIIDRIDF